MLWSRAVLCDAVSLGALPFFNGIGSYLRDLMRTRKQSDWPITKNKPHVGGKLISLIDYVV